MQNLPDLDRTPQAQDPFCGRRTYDGHDGVDVRIRSAAMRAGVDAFAPARGVVRAVRDGEPDGAARSSGIDAVRGKECGNGVLIEIGAGRSIQLCHLRRGSVVVKPGQSVAAGERVGLVGQSGMAQFPHVHMALRAGNDTLDPFSGRPLGAAACDARADRHGLWSPEARAALPFSSRSGIADWGFVDSAPAAAQDADLLPPAVGRSDAQALVFFAHFAGPAAGDELVVRLTSPQGVVIANSNHTQTRDQAQFALFAGKKTPPGGWPTGIYRGEASLIRNGVTIATRSETLHMSR